MLETALAKELGFLKPDAEIHSRPFTDISHHPQATEVSITPSSSA